jgi:beta-mannosidase
MVWQDFAFACALYPQTPEFHQKVEQEAQAIIPLLRNHPSLVLWAGNNEIDAFYSFAKPKCDPNLDDRISREVLASACRRLDPWREYLPSSPYFSPKLWSLGAPHDRRPEDHLWGPRDDFKGDFYRSSNAHFASEIGYHGCPSRSSLERMMRPENLWPWQDNEDWLTHAARPQKRGTAYNYRIQLMADQIRVLFGAEPTGLDDFIFASQVSQAEALKYFIERFRIAKGRRSGILWWNLRDGWPLISDAVVDYYGERKRAYDVIKRVQSDVCVMLDEPEDGTQNVVAVNDTLRSAAVAFKVRTDDEELLTGTVEIEPNGRADLGRVPASSDREFRRIEWAWEGKAFWNHYLAGPRPFDLESLRNWYRQADLD